MIFPYQRITAKIARPLIYIIIRSATRFAIYPVLIDSGADHCIFSRELTKDLGIKLQSTKIIFMGVGKDKIIGSWGEVDLKIGNITYNTKVIFAEISKFGHGILGQKGFFDHFDVKLSYQKQIIEIEQIKLTN